MAYGRFNVGQDVLSGQNRPFCITPALCKLECFWRATPFLKFKGEESYLGVRLGATNYLYGQLPLWVGLSH